VAVGPGAGQQTAPPPGQAGGAAGQFPLQSNVPGLVAPQAFGPEVQPLPKVAATQVPALLMPLVHCAAQVLAAQLARPPLRQLVPQQTFGALQAGGATIGFPLPSTQVIPSHPIVPLAIAPQPPVTEQKLPKFPGKTGAVFDEQEPSHR